MTQSNINTFEEAYEQLVEAWEIVWNALKEAIESIVSPLLEFFNNILPAASETALEEPLEPLNDFWFHVERIKKRRDYYV